MTRAIVTPSPVAQRTPLAVTLSLLGAGAAVLYLPYLFPVRPTVSVSYVVGYNNRAAVVILAVCTAVFSYFMSGEIARREEIDSRLSRRFLLSSLVIVLAACLLQWRPGMSGQAYWDATYFVQRQQLLAVGLKPYRDFEFAYGPLLLYPAFWMARLTGLSQVTGYYIVWTFEWVLGTTMLGCLVRHIDFPIPSRRGLFTTLLVIQLASLITEGETYTPFRGYFAAFLILAVYWFWRRSGNIWALAGISILAVGLSVLCSMEQAIGATAGLFALLLLVALRRKSALSFGTVPTFLVGVGICLLWADHVGMLATFRSFAEGGYAFPLLLSAPVLVVLFAYLVAGCVFYRRILRGDLESILLPLVVGGCAMLPSALTRSDVYHLCTAAPLFLVGASAIFTMRSVRALWVPLACYFLWLPSLHLYRMSWQGGLRFSRIAVAQIENTPNLLADLPCDRTYFAPTLLLPAAMKVAPACLDTGYYLGPVNVSTSEGIARKLSEFKKRPMEPLLLDSRLLEDQFATDNDDPQILRVFQVARLPLPRRMNPPITYSPIASYIRSHYTPGPLLGKTGIRVWYPAGEPH